MYQPPTHNTPHSSRILSIHIRACDDHGVYVICEDRDQGDWEPDRAVFKVIPFGWLVCVMVVVFFVDRLTPNYHQRW